ncbi:MAG TPA: LytTR family DNA-binding domain-containing protein [Bacteroidota bacterium]|nr:LytTR family DNA-binding domain-containing protein [Bacteroidota bacterium]
MKLVVIEDELPARRMLTEMIREIDDSIEIVGSMGSVAEAIEWFNTHKHPDIVLMDIQLSDGISFSILKEVRIESLLVFTTAFDEYAIQAFKVNSLDYILKPFDIDDLRRAFNKFEEYSRKFLREKNTDVRYDDIVAAIRNSRTEYRERFLIHSAESFYKLPVRDIAYFYSANKITFAVTFEAREVPIDFSLEKLQEELDPAKYFKVNRQYIVNIDSIHKVHSFFQGKLTIDTRPSAKIKIVVGKDKAAQFKQWMDR